jgi:hypothetical protein
MAMARHFSEQHRRQRGKNVALLVTLLVLVGLVYAIAVVRMSGA